MPRDVRVRNVNSSYKNFTPRETPGKFCLFVCFLLILEGDRTLVVLPLRSRGIRLSIKKISLPILSWGSLEINGVVAR